MRDARLQKGPIQFPLNGTCLLIILVVTAFLIQMIYYGMNGDYRVSDGSRAEFFGVAAVLTFMAIWRHRANIGRLLHGTENKLWGGKK